jgi:hypothetical protein
MAPVVAGDADAVAARGGAPLAAWVVFQEVERAVGREARAQALPVRSGEKLDRLVSDELYGEVRGRSGAPVGT